MTILLYALMADSTIETLVSGSDVRWILLTITALYGIATAILWRRLSWEIKAQASTLALLAMLAVTAWLPGGLTSGIRLLGQSTSAVLGFVSAVAVAVAGLGFARDRNLPGRARIAAGVLACYGVAAFLVGIFRGTPYSDLFHGRSLWVQLPFWLQGAVLGGLLVVPTSIAFHAITRLFKRSSLSLQRSAVYLTALALCVTVAIAGLRGPANVQVSKTSPALMVDQLEKLSTAVEAAYRDLPRDTFDPQAVVKSVGNDPTRLFEWVRDNTFFVAYRGALRGPTGVLMDRLGNSLDRALLLYQLLHLAGHTSRLAHGTMVMDQAERALALIRPVPAAGALAATATPSRQSGALLEDYVQRFQLDRTQLDEIGKRMRQARGLFSEQITARVEKQAQELAEIVGVRTASADDRAAQLETLEDHWWVQWQSDTGWLDLDPTLPTLRPGQALASANETLQPNGLSDLTQDLLHLVQVRLVVEFWKDGRLNEITVLTELLVPAEFFSETVIIRHVPIGWPETLDVSRNRDAVSSLKAEVLARREWIPILAFGSREVVGSTFRDDGGVTETSVSGAASTGRRIERILGGDRKIPPTGSPNAVSRLSDDSILTAEWIEYQIRSPGRTARTIRRELFDLIGPADRSLPNIPRPNMTSRQQLERGLALMGETEVLIQVAQLSPELVGDLMARRYLADQKTAIELLRRASGRPGLLREGSGLRLLPSRLYSLALARRDWARSPADLYLDRPNILSWHSRMREGAQGDLLLLRAFDIVANEVAVRPGTRLDPFLIRIAQGVVDTNSEALLFRRSDRVENAAEIFALSNPRDRWVLVRHIEEPLWRRINMDKDLRARIEHDLEVGYIVVVPRTPVLIGGQSTIAWWRVDPRTGDTLGIGSRGWGQTASEQPLVTTTAVRRMVHAVTIIAALKCIYTHSPTPGMGGPSLDRNDALDTAAGIDREYARRTGYPTPSDIDLANREGGALLGWMAICAFIGGVAMWSLSGTMAQLIAQLIAGGIGLVI